MPRTTIDYGIDLGTTNSTIAVLAGAEVEVFRNNEGFEYTPSVVWLDRNNSLIVGRAAKERLFSDVDNAFAEFKLQMGSDREYRFARSGRIMRPEDLSAEVLKSLKSDVRQRKGEEVEAAVICVPAAFELPQCEATRRAAERAGLKHTPLLQEPVAAALAYSFQSESDRVFWLVYDLGGGTFDAAVMQVRDGVIQVVNHGGDNHLGGKLIDWAIVEQILIPALVKERSLSDFRRGNPKWVAAVAKLKLAAEEAKIRVSRAESALIDIEFLCQDDRGEPVRFEYELQRQQVEGLAEPFILRSINISKQVLAEKHLGVDNVEKVLLVGGPTLMPYLRQRLVDAGEGLGIPLEFSIDPLTVVARGAAIFASTQRLHQDAGALTVQRQAGTFTISFPKWAFKGSDTEPLVAGVVQPPDGQSLQGHTVEFINASVRPQWRSGKIGLAANGGFMTTLWAEKGKLNTFDVELCDATGHPCPVATDPAPLTYTVGLVIGNPPLTHSVGVALANNEVLWFLEKGTPLPARKRVADRLHTVFPVRRGQAGDVLRIPVVEGGSRRADRNRDIGALEVKPHQLRYDLPAGSEVEVTIEIDESRLVRTKAFIPLVDEEFEEVLQLGAGKAPGPAELRKQVDAEKKRLQELRQQAEQTQDAQAAALLRQIDAEHLVNEIDAALDASAVDPDASDKCLKRLQDLRLKLDGVEEALEWPTLLAEAERAQAAARADLGRHGKPEDRTVLQQREADLHSAMQTRDADLLRQRIEGLRQHVFRVLDREGILPVLVFQFLCNQKARMRDQAAAEQLISRGLRAMNANQIEDLRAVNRELRELLPPGERDSTIQLW